MLVYTGSDIAAFIAKQPAMMEILHTVEALRLPETVGSGRLRPQSLVGYPP